jgi:hypothetical protein
MHRFLFVLPLAPKVLTMHTSRDVLRSTGYSCAELLYVRGRRIDGLRWYRDRFSKADA